MMNVVSFTGTQTGMTKKQKESFRDLVQKLKPDAFIHGDCIGSDHDAHQIVRELYSEDQCIIAIRPCVISYKKAFTDGFLLDEPNPPLDRNKKIVDDGNVLIATPKEFEEQLRSGTWSTVRYARKKNKLIYVINPDGVVSEL